MTDTRPDPFAPQKANQTAIRAIPVPELPRCDCLVDPYHRWNCPLTPGMGANHPRPGLQPLDRPNPGWPDTGENYSSRYETSCEKSLTREKSDSACECSP